MKSRSKQPWLLQDVEVPRLVLFGLATIVLAKSVPDFARMLGFEDRTIGTFRGSPRPSASSFVQNDWIS